MVYDVDVGCSILGMMTRTQILLEENQYRWLADQARRHKTSLSQILRQMIETHRLSQLRRRHDDPLFRLIGLGKDRARDVSEHHDKYLYQS